MNVATGGTVTMPAPYVSSKIHPTDRRSRLNVPVDRSRCSSNACTIAATTRSSARPKGERRRVAR
ncbi:hypothetical protein BOQ63_007375 (plasmid) [Streptomyces viridifaciens]|nr:hypothetical protein BOQ63_007375 [Streptomyces viridifaciens]